MINQKHTAIRATHPSVVTIRGDVAYDAQDNVVEYDKAAVEAHAASKEYITKRAAEYPSIGDQLDALWKGGEAATEMLAQVQAVKNKYPKGTE
jgi:hypothetical protein